MEEVQVQMHGMGPVWQVTLHLRAVRCALRVFEEWAWVPVHPLLILLLASDTGIVVVTWHS